MNQQKCDPRSFQSLRTDILPWSTCLATLYQCCLRTVPPSPPLALVSWLRIVCSSSSFYKLHHHLILGHHPDHNFKMPRPVVLSAGSKTNRQQQRPYNNPGSSYLQNGSSGLPPPGAAPLLPNQGRVIQTGPIRVLCIADVRGELSRPDDAGQC